MECRRYCTVPYMCLREDARFEVDFERPCGGVCLGMLGNEMGGKRDVRTYIGTAVMADMINAAMEEYPLHQACVKRDT